MEAIKKNDIVGNKAGKFRFQVIEITFTFDSYQEFIVQDMATFEKFKSSSDEMRLSK